MLEHAATVAENVDNIQTVSDNLESIVTVANNIEDIKAVTSLEGFNDVASVHQEISALGERVTALEENPVDLSDTATKSEVEELKGTGEIVAGESDLTGLAHRVDTLEANVSTTPEIDLSEYSTTTEITSAITSATATINTKVTSILGGATISAGTNDLRGPDNRLTELESSVPSSSICLMTAVTTGNLDRMS